MYYCRLRPISFHSRVSGILWCVLYRTGRKKNSRKKFGGLEKIKQKLTTKTNRV